MVEDMTDGDEHLSRDHNESLVVSATFRDSVVESAESWVVSCGMMGQDSAYVAVSFFRDWVVQCAVAGLMSARGEACVADELLRGIEPSDWTHLDDPSGDDLLREILMSPFRRLSPLR
jgi:hypothetical protein